MEAAPGARGSAKGEGSNSTSQPSAADDMLAAEQGVSGTHTPTTAP